MQGQDVALLLKLAIQKGPQVPSKDLAENLFISPSEVSKSLKRSAERYLAGAAKMLLAEPRFLDVHPGFVLDNERAPLIQQRLADIALQE